MAFYNGPEPGDDFPTDIEVDAQGNIYLTGTNGSDYMTIKMDPSGTVLWVRFYDGPGHGDDRAEDLELDSLGNVYVTGYSDSGDYNYDYATIKYAPDCNSNGVPDAYDLAAGTSEDCDGNTIPDECEAARWIAAGPADQASLGRTQNNTIRLTFDRDLITPTAGQITIQQLLDGGAYGPDLSAGFVFTVEDDDWAHPRILRIRENGAVFTHRTRVGVRTSGDWCNVAPFEVQYVVMVGDVNADKKVLASDLIAIFPKIPTANAGDQERADVNGDGEVLASDLSAVFPHIPSAPVPKPSGH